MKHIMLYAAIMACVSTYAQPAVGDAAHEISLPDVNGAVKELSSMKGKVVLVDFWASWCAPCRKANREIAPLYSKYHDKGFEIFSVSVDDDQQAWKKAIIADKAVWTQVHQPGGWDAPVAVAWNVEALPATWLLDKEGRVVAVNPDKKTIASFLKTQYP